MQTLFYTVKLGETCNKETQNHCLYSQTLQVNTDTTLGTGGGGGSIEGVGIKRVEFRENVRANFPQRQTKLCVIMRCLGRCL